MKHQIQIINNMISNFEQNSKIFPRNIEETEATLHLFG